MKDIEKYVGYYLLVYLIVLTFCGFFQYMSVCQGKSLVCAFSMKGMNTIITTTAYVLTPIVAIIGFLNWKRQHNKLVLADEAKKLLLAIKLFTDISGRLRQMSSNATLKEIFDEDLHKKVQNLSNNISNVSSKAIVLYELTDDEELNEIRHEYSYFIYNLHTQIANDYINNQLVKNTLLVLDSNKDNFMINNKLYKRLVRQYIIAK